jgi:hypothetical protein
LEIVKHAGKGKESRLSGNTNLEKRIFETDTENSKRMQMLLVLIY